MSWKKLNHKTVPGNKDLNLTTWKFSPVSGDKHGVISLERIRDKASTKAKSTLLYLPGTWGNSTLIDYRENYEFRIYLARNQVDIFSLDYRTHSADIQDQDNLSFMADWTYGVFLEDIKKSVDFIKKITKTDKIFIAGMSRGGTLAYYYACRNWFSDLAGLIILDGSLWWDYFSFDHKITLKEALDSFRIQAAFQEETASREQLMNVGRYSINLNFTKQLIQQAIDNPNAPSPVEGPKNLAEYMAERIHNSRGPCWGSKGIANLFEGYNNIEILLAWLLSKDPYWPIVQIAESISLHSQGIGSSEITYANQINEVDVPVIAFFSQWYYSLDEKLKATKYIGSRDVTTQILNNWGHADILFGEYAHKKVFKPMCRWLKEKV
ncbi:MAG: hypothetical protein K9L86_00350 [Candidatus Omnitrophica bacterium]|nr:hypothetical protein [Candidatus Omnitrophota bacterium]